MKAPLVLVALAMVAVACGGRAAQGLDASVDGGEAGIVDAGVVDPDAAPLYCWSECGEVDAAFAPDFGVVVVCPPGQVCGFRGGAVGYECCTLDGNPDHCERAGPTC